jgi:hypothetical protein
MDLPIFVDSGLMDVIPQTRVRYTINI